MQPGCHGRAALIWKSNAINFSNNLAIVPALKIRSATMGRVQILSLDNVTLRASAAAELRNASRL